MDNTSDGTLTNYANAGFDEFLQRTIDGPAVGSLSAVGNTAPQQTVAFDHTAISGALGDKLSVGNITIDGQKGRISVADDQDNETVRLGEQNE